MTRLEELSSKELVEEARLRAEQAKADDERMGAALAGLMRTVDEMARRLDGEDE